MSDSLLMIFVKNLIPGMVKTRLAEGIGINKALDVYMELVKHTNSIANKVDTDKGVYYSDYIEVEDVWDTEEYDLNVQKGNNLGERMSNAFDEAFDSYKRVVIIGSDCYDLGTTIIQDAFNLLEENDVVVGPAKDGGYYLLGMSEYFPKLFQNKEYSTESVLYELLEEAKDPALSVHNLPILSDIDTLADLKETDMQWENTSGEGDFEGFEGNGD